MLTALAEEPRLTIIGLISQKPYSVREMAEVIELTNALTFKHLNALHHAGLLNFHLGETEQFYQINPQRIARLKAYMALIDTAPTEPLDEESDNTWIDALDFDEDDKAVLRTYTFNGRITQFPTKDKKWQAILRWIARRFEAGRRYPEKQVNAMLVEVHVDYATLRRSLVEYGFMERDRGGSEYWLASNAA